LTLPTDLRATPRVSPQVSPRSPQSPQSPQWLPWRVRRELILFGALLLFGLVGVPLLIWTAGNRWLGPYGHELNLHAGPLALLQDFFASLLHGSAVFWVVALGPAAFVLLVRLFIAGVRALPPGRDGEPPAPAARREPRWPV
jgi:hypothetical protein